MIVGTVIKSCNAKTVTVQIERHYNHPIYKKTVRQFRKFLAHDLIGAKVGDKVSIISTRPFSKLKKHAVKEIL